MKILTLCVAIVSTTPSSVRRVDGFSFVPGSGPVSAVAHTRGSPKGLGATPEDVEALASRISDPSKVEALFTVDGELVRFFRRDEFCQRVAALPGAGAPSDDALLEFWTYFGGAPPAVERAQPNKAANQGFFASFASTIAANAMGSIDDRPKDEWGNPKKEQTIVSAQMMLNSELADAGFTREAFADALLTNSEA